MKKITLFLLLIFTFLFVFNIQEIKAINYEVSETEITYLGNDYIALKPPSSIPLEYMRFDTANAPDITFIDRISTNLLINFNNSTGIGNYETIEDFYADIVGGFTIYETLTLTNYDYEYYDENDIPFVNKYVISFEYSFPDGAFVIANVNGTWFAVHSTAVGKVRLDFVLELFYSGGFQYEGINYLSIFDIDGSLIDSNGFGGLDSSMFFGLAMYTNFSNQYTIGFNAGKDAGYFDGAYDYFINGYYDIDVINGDYSLSDSADWKTGRTQGREDIFLNGSDFYSYNEENSYDYNVGYGVASSESVNSAIIQFLNGFDTWIIPAIILTMIFGAIMYIAFRRKRG